MAATYNYGRTAPPGRGPNPWPLASAQLEPPDGPIKLRQASGQSAAAGSTPIGSIQPSTGSEWRGGAEDGVFCPVCEMMVVEVGECMCC